MEKLRCAVYARVSTEEQAKGDSINHQVDFFNEYAKKNGLEVVESYVDEGLSGTRAESRKAFIRMIRDAKQGRFDIILTKSVSRLARNLRLAVNTIYDLIEKDIRLVTIEDSIDTSKPDARLLLGIHATLAEQESERISARVKFGKMQKAKKGYYTGSYPPYGYCRENKDRIAPANDETTKIVQRIFKMFLDGEGMRGIASVLNNENIPPPSAKRGVSTYSGLWNDRTIKLILTNPVYTGTLAQCKNATKSSISGKRVKTGNAIIAENAIRSVIDKEVFDKAQNLLNGRSDRTYRPESHLFSGMIKCGDCGSRMYYHSEGYFCSKYSRFGNLYCTSHYISEALLLDILRGDIKEAFKQQNKSADCKIDSIFKKVRFDNKQQINSRSYELKEAGRRLEGLKNRIALLLECYADMRMDESDFQEQLQMIIKEKKEVELKKKRLEAEASREDFDDPMEIIKDSMDKILELQNPSPRLIKDLVEGITVFTDHRMIINYNF